jgi:hypothetical protein
MGCIFEGNTFNTGNYSTGFHVYLSNDDFSMDAARDGRYQVDMDQRHPRYCVIANNTYGWSAFYVTTQGFQMMWTNNDIALGGSGVTCVYQIACRTSNRLGPVGVTFFHYDHVISENTFTNGTINYFCVHVPDDADSADAAAILRGRARNGKTTVKNNTAPSAPSQGWSPVDKLADLSGPSLTSSDGPNTVTGNSP